MEYLEGKKLARAHLGRVLVLGLGKSGKSVARYCAELLGTRVDELFIAAGAETPDSRAFVDSLSGSGIACRFGDDALAGFDGRFDICIASPGIPFWHELYVSASALSAELISEVEFSWRESAAESVWVAVTGTNGKTTTTSCCAHILRECGFAASAVGNIGDVCLDAVATGATEVYVAEVSSYQLYSTRSFAPDIPVLLNITPDHLHWHRSLEAYAQAKFNVLRAPEGGGGKRPVAVLDATNDVVRSKVRELRRAETDGRKAAYIPLGTADGIGSDMRVRCGSANAAFIDGEGMLTIAFDGVEHRLIAVDELRVAGEHNASNALAAACAAVVLGADDASIARALATFAPLEHRIEACGAVGTVECYNDSKATNVDATCKALGSFPGRDVVVMLGGDDKGTDLEDLVAAVRSCARAAVCFGEAGPRFAEALERPGGSEGSFACVRAAHLADAFDAALALSPEGGVVLLSPACASFDEFTSFEERGRVFKRLVRERAAAKEA